MKCRLLWLTLFSVPTERAILYVSGNVLHYLYGLIATERNSLCEFLSFRATIKGSFFLSLLLLISCEQHPAETTICVADRKLDLEVANTTKSIQQGLKGRAVSSLCSDCGMFFDWHSIRPVQFWMQDTGIPLDIAFIGEDFIIESIHPMAPGSETRILSGVPVRYAIEMHQGWFASNGISAGDEITFCK